MSAQKTNGSRTSRVIKRMKTTMTAADSARVPVIRVWRREDAIITFFQNLSAKAIPALLVSKDDVSGQVQYQVPLKLVLQSNENTLCATASCAHSRRRSRVVHVHHRVPGRGE